MVVSNHSGGTTIPDVWGFLVAWYRYFGVYRPIHPMAHEMILSNRITGSYFGQRGVLHGCRKLAFEVLTAHQRDLMVMPGGDVDTWRPYSKRYEVCFAGRTGYAKLALQAGVPIVPVANAGAHETLIVLTDGRPLARALRLHDLARADIFPIHLSLPWGLAVGPWPHIPTPVRLRYRIGPPVLPPEGTQPGEEPAEELVSEYDQRVQSAVQRLLDQLRDGG
jgi:1-acyl-sn-glycerol-3-phosphate acyltransferase